MITPTAVYRQNSRIAGVDVNAPMINERPLVSDVIDIDGPASSIVIAKQELHYDIVNNYLPMRSSSDWYLLFAVFCHAWTIMNTSSQPTPMIRNGMTEISNSRLWTVVTYQEW